SIQGTHATFFVVTLCLLKKFNAHFHFQKVLKKCMGFKYTELSVTNLKNYIYSENFSGWKDGEGKNKSPQKAQWHKLKRKVEYQACMWPVFVIPYNFPPWVCGIMLMQMMDNA
ncbi:hypothetical protein ACJX0J_039872, partial [Zea mays]